MKIFEKIITILIALALFVCIYLTGLSAIRTVSRYAPDFIQSIVYHTSEPCSSHAVSVLTRSYSCSPRTHRTNLASAAYLIGTWQNVFCLFPTVTRQITSYTLYVMLYLPTIL